MGFNLDRRLLRRPPVHADGSGAAGAFRRQALTDVGSVRGNARRGHGSDARDRPRRVAGRVPRTRAWTEAPATLRGLWRQRYRWCYGRCSPCGSIVRPCGGRRGLIDRRGLPYLATFQIALPLLAPLIDIFSIYGFLFLNPVGVIAFWAVFTALQMALGCTPFEWTGSRPGCSGRCASAVRLPAAHVHGRHRVGADRPRGNPLPLASDRASRRDRGRQTLLAANPQLRAHPRAA